MYTKFPLYIHDILCLYSNLFSYIFNQPLVLTWNIHPSDWWGHCQRIAGDHEETWLHCPFPWRNRWGRPQQGRWARSTIQGGAPNYQLEVGLPFIGLIKNPTGYPFRTPFMGVTSRVPPCSYRRCSGFCPSFFNGVFSVMPELFQIQRRLPITGNPGRSIGTGQGWFPG